MLTIKDLAQQCLRRPCTRLTSRTVHLYRAFIEDRSSALPIHVIRTVLTLRTALVGNILDLQDRVHIEDRSVLIHLILQDRVYPRTAEC